MKDQIILIIYWAVIISLAFFCLIKIAPAQTIQHIYTEDEYCDAIFWSEGGYKTNFPYGIKSIDCGGDYERCRRYSKNTIRNNRRRYRNLSEKERVRYGSYLVFLQSRYCPITGDTDSCKAWLTNVKWFLENPKGVK